MIKDMVRDFFSAFFWVVFALGVFSGLIAIHLLYREAPIGEWLPWVFWGSIMVAIGGCYHRKSWIFQMPMNSRDIKLYVEGNEHKGKGE